MNRTFAYLLLLYCACAFAGDPRGAEFLPRVVVDDADAAALYHEVVTPQTLLPGEAPLQPTERRLVIHSRPVWRVNDAGNIAAIDTSVEGGVESLKAVWRADGNTVKFRVTEDGVCIYRVGQHVLRVRPARHGTEATDGTVIAESEQVKPTQTDATTNAVVQRGSFADVRIEHVVEPGQVKEIAWLDTAPAGIATARWYALAYQWQSDTLTPTIVAGDVLWKTAAGKTILRWPAPVVTDAARKALRAQYRMRAGVVAVLVNGTDLRGATYPVAIDPTTTTALGESLVGRSTRTSPSTLRYKGAYLKFTMPTMSGNTVTDCTVQLNATTNAGPIGSVSTYARAVSDTGAYDNSSTYTTLDALSLGTAVSTASSFGSGTGTKTVNIFGDATKGVSKFYTDNPTGGAMCVAFIWTAFTGSLTTASALLYLGDDDVVTPLIIFSAYNDATNYPRVTVTYTVGSGGFWQTILLSEE